MPSVAPRTPAAFQSTWNASFAESSRFFCLENLLLSPADPHPPGKRGEVSPPEPDPAPPAPPHARPLLDGVPAVGSAAGCRMWSICSPRKTGRPVPAPGPAVPVPIAAPRRPRITSSVQEPYPIRKLHTARIPAARMAATAERDPKEVCDTMVNPAAVSWTRCSDKAGDSSKVELLSPLKTSTTSPNVAWLRSTLYNVIVKRSSRHSSPKACQCKAEVKVPCRAQRSSF